MNPMPGDLSAFVTRYYSAVPDSVRLNVLPFRGGLESLQVAHVCCEYRDRRDRARAADFVVKRAGEDAAREAAAYRLLLSKRSSTLAPRLLGIDPMSDGTVQFYLEWIKPWKRWPWKDAVLIARAMEQLAAVHTTLSTGWFLPPHRLSRWDYDRELLASAASTLEFFERGRLREEAAPFRRAMPALRRLTAALPRLRRHLLAGELGSTVLHGDVHSGNLVVRSRGGRRELVLLDWGRTRVGSPLEDVSSWLQSLGFWEAEARRLHDTFVRRYLAARGMTARFTRGLREHYWIAAACNGLAGAIRYHLHTVLDDARPPAIRQASESALLDWIRVLRRADAASHA
jgi:hypothetical protein